MEQPKFEIAHLINLIGLYQIVTGEKPKSLTLTPEFYNWYIQNSQQLAEAYNFNLGFKNDKVIFNGVELIKKLNLATEKG